MELQVTPQDSLSSTVFSVTLFNCFVIAIFKILTSLWRNLSEKNFVSKLDSFSYDILLHLENPMVHLKGGIVLDWNCQYNVRIGSICRPLESIINDIWFKKFTYHYFSPPTSYHSWLPSCTHLHLNKYNRVWKSLKKYNNNICFTWLTCTWDILERWVSPLLLRALETLAFIRIAFPNLKVWVKARHLVS